MYKVTPKFQPLDKWMEIPFEMKNLEIFINIFLSFYINESRGVLCMLGM